MKKETKIALWLLITFGAMAFVVFWMRPKLEEVDQERCHQLVVLTIVARSAVVAAEGATNRVFNKTYLEYLEISSEMCKVCQMENCDPSKPLEYEE